MNRQSKHARRSRTGILVMQGNHVLVSSVRCQFTPLLASIMDVGVQSYTLYMPIW